jgi:DNA mismatch repair protein MutL
MINLIAAGEVVERPASVVKELLENSMDAGARNISVELARGGRKSIAVRDDGSGMGRHDLLLAVERHATSKLSRPEDLDRIDTLGFRGEALPSIAAVSRLTILTSEGDQGWKLAMAGGEVKDLSPAARSRGTTVTVEALFFNQPARRKFLSSEATELSWIERIVTGCALARPEVSFSLSHDDRALFRLPRGESPEARLRTRYSLGARENCARGRGDGEGVCADLLAFPGKLWNGRRHQYILVNGRLVSSPMISSAVNGRLEGPAGSPLFFCSLSLPPEAVDVNAHPTKKEVRFRNPGAVLRAVEAALADMVPERSAGLEARFPGISFEGPAGPDYRARQAALELSSPAAAGSASVVMEPGEVPGWEDPVPIMQVSDSYLITASGEGILVVDQHAAHERVLFEQILNNLREASPGGRQQLLLPEVLHLDRDETAVIRLYGPMIVQAGFDLRVSGDTVEILAVPEGISRGAEAVREILEAFSTGRDHSFTQQEILAAATACKGAVTFGQKLSLPEIRSLFHRLFATSDPFRCPHGRPTLVEITFDELEKRFGR